MKMFTTAAALLACAGATCAQSMQPQFYMWNEPDVAWPGDMQFVPLVMVPADGGGAANGVRDKIEQFIQKGWADDARIAIVLQGFGEPHPTQGLSARSLLHEDDILYPLPVWSDNPNHAVPTYGQYLQPWMNNARPVVGTWVMNAFLNLYDTLYYEPSPGGGSVPLPIPARFHFDTEVNLSGLAFNHVRILEAVAQDDRWDTVAVPGFGASTMADLYAKAVADYDWDDVPLHQAIDRLWSPNTPENHPYFLWYYRNVQQARDGAMAEVAYDRIRQHWPTNTPLVSNYADFNADGQNDTFGWYRGWQPGTSYGPERIANRGWIDRGGPGSLHRPNILVDPVEGYYGTWLTYRGSTVADFSAPVLYGYLTEHGYENHRGPDYYLPGHPQESRWNATLRNTRHQVESILNTVIANGPAGHKVAPWIQVPGASSEPNNHQYTITDEDARRQLAMLRAKNIDEILVFWNWQLVNLNWWDYRDLVGQVYTPSLDAVALYEGTLLSPDLGVDRVRYTLREDDPGDETIDILGGPGGIVALFTNMSPPLGDTLRLNIELSVELETETAEDMRVRAYVWSDISQDWLVVPCDPIDPCPDYSLEPNVIGFWAPADPGSGDKIYEMRRTFSMPGYFVESNFLAVKLVVYNVVDDAFEVRFDLVQVYWAGGTGQGLMMGGFSTQGADVNYDGVVDLKDLEKFLLDYQHGRPPADFNNDGIIDEADMAAFLAAYGQ